MTAACLLASCAPPPPAAAVRDVDVDRPRDAAALAAQQAAASPERTRARAADDAEIAAARERARIYAIPPVAVPVTAPQRDALVLPDARSANTPQNDALGVNFGNYFVSGGGARSYPYVRSAGARHERVTFNMNAIEPGNDGFQWAGYDALVADASAQNLEILGVLIAPANFARRDCGNFFGVPTNVDLPWNDPNNHWAQFVYATVARYKSHVRSWEIWNEPNFFDFWCGTAEEFAQMTRVSYFAIRAADPSATVVLAPMYRGVELGRIIAFFEALRALPDAAAHGFFHDVIGFHLYDGGHCTQFDEVEYLRRNVFTPNVGAKPIWNTESGVRVRDGAWPGFATSEESAWFLVANAAYSFHKGMQRYYWFRAIDEIAVVSDVDSDKAWGLLRYDGSPRPTYAAFQTIAHHLPREFAWSVRRFGTRFADNDPSGPISRITFYGTPLGRVSVLFNISRDAQTYAFAGILPTAEFIAPDGSRAQQARAGDGSHTLNFAAASNFRWQHPECQVPSRPIIIVEPDVAAPATRLSAPTPDPADPLRLALRWSSDDGADGSGVWWYDVQVQRDDGAWALLDDDVYAGEYVAALSAAGRYRFRVRAWDRAGNAGPWATSSPVAVTDTIIPTPTPASRQFAPDVRQP
jgi:hypothetical protein